MFAPISTFGCSQQQMHLILSQSWSSFGALLHEVEGSQTRGQSLLASNLMISSLDLTLPAELLAPKLDSAGPQIRQLHPRSDLSLNVSLLPDPRHLWGYQISVLEVPISSWCSAERACNIKVLPWWSQPAFCWCSVGRVCVEQFS